MLTNNIGSNNINFRLDLGSLKEKTLAMVPTETN
jgi:hypothetical protein